MEVPIDCPVCFESYPYFVGHEDRQGNTFILNASMINPADVRAHLICINCLSQLNANHRANNVNCPICRTALVGVAETLNDYERQNLPRDPLPSAEESNPNNIFPPPGAAPAADRMVFSDDEFSDEEFEYEPAGVGLRAMGIAPQENPHFNPNRFPEPVREPRFADDPHYDVPLYVRSALPPMPWYKRLGIAIVIGACLIVVVATVALLCALILRAVRQRVAATV